MRPGEYEAILSSREGALDALYADGCILAELKYGRQIDALVRLPEGRRMYGQLFGLLRILPEAWQTHQNIRYVSGHKQIRQMRVAKVDELNDWGRFCVCRSSLGSRAAFIRTASQFRAIWSPIPFGVTAGGSKTADSEN